MLPSLILSRFFWLSTKLQWYFLFCEIPWHLRMFTFYKILNDPKWRKKIASSAPRCSFFGMSTYSLPIKECNHATQNYVIEKQRLNFDFETRDVWCWVLNRFSQTQTSRFELLRLGLAMRWSLEDHHSQRPGVLKTKKWPQYIWILSQDCIDKWVATKLAEHKQPSPA